MKKKVRWRGEAMSAERFRARSKAATADEIQIQAPGTSQYTRWQSWRQYYVLG